MIQSVMTEILLVSEKGRCSPSLLFYSLGVDFLLIFLNVAHLSKSREWPQSFFNPKRKLYRVRSSRVRLRRVYTMAASFIELTRRVLSIASRTNTMIKPAHSFGLSISLLNIPAIDRVLQC